MPLLQTATPGYTSRYTNTHEDKYATQWSNYIQGRTAICSSLTRCHSAIVPFPPPLLDASSLTVIICGGASPVGPFSLSELRGKEGTWPSEVTRPFDLAFVSHADDHMRMTSNEPPARSRSAELSYSFLFFCFFTPFFQRW